MCVLNVMYHVLWGINTYCLLNNRKNRFVVILTSVLLFFIFVSSTGESGDAYKYKMDYENSAYQLDGFELGYILLKLICRGIGVNSYNQFLIVVFLLSSLLIYCGLKKLECNAHAVFAVSMGFVFPALVVAIRFFIALAIFIYSLDYLLNGKRTKYLIAILIAAMFHRSAAFFAIFLICGKMDKQPSGKMISRVINTIGVVSILSVVYIYIYKQVPLMSWILGIIGSYSPAISTKINAYFGSMTRYGMLIMFVVYFANYIFSRNMGRLRFCRNMKNNLDRIAATGLSANILSSVLLPFTVFNLVFFRLYIAQTFFNCLTISKYMDTREPLDSGVIKINLKIMLFIGVIVSWMAPAAFSINSISIASMISGTFLYDIFTI